MWWILRRNFEPASKGFPVVKNFGAIFAVNDDGAMGPSKITLNFAISKFVSHRNRIPRQFCLHAFFTANFAGDIFRHEFRRQNFSPAPSFRRRRFSPAPFFRRQHFSSHSPFMLGSKPPTRRFCLLFKKGKQSSPKLPLCTLSLLVKIPIFIRLS